MGKSSATRKNPRALAATRRRVVELGRTAVKVGWSVEIKASARTVEIATINVLGAPSANIPPRDPITPMLRGNANTIRGFKSKAVKAANKGEDPTPALDQLASFLDREVTQSVRDFSSPGNAPSTVAKKKFNDPLVGAGGDGGRLVAEVGAKVVKR